MLKVKKVSKRFGNIVALDELSFDLGKGEFIFVAGPSGSGKTTLIKLIIRELLPDSGEIIFDGKNIATFPEEETPLLRRRMGVVFQDYKVLPERTMRENIEVALAVSGVKPSKWKKRVDDVLAMVGLIDRSELFPAQLSGGELQRVSLARALVIDPDIILADEPTGNLDWDTAYKIVELLDRINKQGKTVLMATHHRGIVDKMKKRVVELKKPVGGQKKKVKAEVKEKSKKEEKKK